MSLLAQYRTARSAEYLARLRRIIALRAMVAGGVGQRQIAAALGISQPAISQQLRTGIVADADPRSLIEAGGAILRQVAEERGFADLAVFGSVARGEARHDSDIDLLVRPAAGTSVKGLRDLQELLAVILDRRVDVMTYGGLRPGLDDDVLSEAVLL
jgi:predicted nucleotidyltransferase